MCRESLSKSPMGETCLRFTQPGRSVTQCWRGHKTTHCLTTAALLLPAPAASLTPISLQGCRNAALQICFQIPTEICIHCILTALHWVWPLFLFLLLPVASKSFALRKRAAALCSYCTGCTTSLPLRCAAIESAFHCLKVLFPPPS